MLKLFYKLTLLFLLIASTTVLYQKHTYAYQTLVRINPIPQTKALIAEKKYVDAYEYLNYFMDFTYVQKDPEAQALFKQIKEERNSLAYQSQKIAEGITTGTSDELLGQASAIGSDFFVLGDLRDLALEGSHYFKDEEMDTVLIALSSIGLIASLSTLFTLGSSAVAKSGISVLKLAHKGQALPHWLRNYLSKEVKIIRKSKDLSSLKPIFTSLNTLQNTVGVRQTLLLLSHTISLKELQGLSKLSKRYGEKTATILQLSQKQVLIKQKQLKKIDIKTIELASTYGTSGFIHLIKGGEKNFLTKTKRMKAYSKVGYKGEVWKMFLWLMKYLNDTLLFLIMSISTSLLIPWKKVKKLHRLSTIHKIKA